MKAEEAAGTEKCTSFFNYSLSIINYSHELDAARQAVAAGNEGRARVCARRAVAALIQEIAPSLGLDAGTNALANLRFIKESPALPVEVRDAAGRLLGGARSILAGEIYSTDPVADAEAIIRHYIGSTP